MTRPPTPLPSAAEVLAVYQMERVRLDDRRDVTEGSYYPLLKDLLEGFAPHCGAAGARAILLPRPDEVGVPDLRVTRRDHTLVGYVEVKPPGTDLVTAERLSQIRRYRKGYPNLLLTDTRHFRLYHHGKKVEVREISQGVGPLGVLLGRFFGFAAPPHRGAASLTRDLAFKTRVLAAVVERALAREGGGRPELEKLHEALSKHLIHGLDRNRFADLYAQTLAYGLLAARHWSPRDGFDRRVAYGAIPPTLGVLRDLFRYVLFDEPPEEVRWIADDLAATLAAADVEGILKRSVRRGKGRDPVLHLYESFLARYDPSRRRRRGVYYTPPELVSYVVRSVDRLLRERLGRSEGLADASVTVLDPAGGTLTFLMEALRRALESHTRRFGEASRRGARNELLERFFAFELMPAPYAVGHLKMSLMLEEMGCPLEEGQRVHAYLTDALDDAEVEQLNLPGVASLAQEARAALELKFVRPVTVVLGNPPWAGHSANPHGWMDASLKRGYARPDGSRDDGYYRAGGEPLGERNLKWLQDDYVKFLRFAQWKIDQTGEGIVALVTNHGYLDNPTFRGMRESLLGSFDELYFLDLHGNRKKRERPPDGGRDANVFDVQQGVAVALLVKRPGLPRRVLHHELWGRRAAKEAWLAGHDVATTPWEPLDPRPPGLYFVPRDAVLEDRWRPWPAVDELFELGSVGVITGRDELVVHADAAELAQQIGRFRTEAGPGVAQSLCLSLKIPDTKRWQCEGAWQRARLDELWRERILPYLVRPFDHRWVLYADYMLERPREAVMRHLAGGSNPALLVTRQARRRPGVFVTDRLAGHKVLSTFDVNYVFPLYRLAGEDAQPSLLDDPAAGPVANVTAGAVSRLAELWGEAPTPEALLGFLYGVLSSRSYQRRWAPLLATGFPRVAFPRSAELFERLSTLGSELVDLHLLHHPRLADPGVRFEGAGSGCLGMDRAALWDYHAEKHRLYVNEDRQWLAPVPPAVWGYTIGDHRVLAAWLEARKEQRLDAAAVRHLCRTAAALTRSLPILDALDELVDAVEREAAPWPGR